MVAAAAMVAEGARGGEDEDKEQQGGRDSEENDYERNRLHREW